MFGLPDLPSLVFMLPAIIVALTLHEFAHGLVADQLGDRTARSMGRLTLNPLAHIDPVGLLLLFLAGFGWAKPVPVNPYNLRGDIQKGMLLVSLAGPLANLFIAVFSSFFLGLLYAYRVPYLEQVVLYMIKINVVLAVFNLLPVPPLDGSRILAGLLPGSSRWLYQLEGIGAVILVLLVFTGVISAIFKVVVNPLVRMMYVIARMVYRVVS